MKILIIALPRTGSSNLLFSLAKDKNLIPIFEPFSQLKKNDDIIRTYNSNDDNVIVKTIIFQHPDNISLCKEFDEIILLSRKDLLACAESWAYFSKNKINGFGSWLPYVYEGITDTEVKYSLKVLVEYNSLLKQISNTLDVPITYYEDLYDLSSPNKLRKSNKVELKKNIL